MTHDLRTGLDEVPPAGDRPTADATGCASIDAEARRRIGRNLRLLYAPVLTQALPDRFAALLDALSAPDAGEPS